MKPTHQWACVMLAATVVSASAKTLLFDVRPVGRGDGDSNVSVPADFAVYDPNVALAAPIAISTIQADYNAGITLTDEDADTYSLAVTGGGVGFFNAGSASWNNTTPILEGYNYNANGRTFTISGAEQFPAGEVITLTLFGIGDNVGQGAKFTPSYGSTALLPKDTSFGTVRATETGATPFAQWQFTSDGTTPTISFLVQTSGGGSTLNGFSITSAPANYGNVNSVTVTPESVTQLVGGPEVQLAASADFTLAGVIDVTALGVTDYVSNFPGIASVNATGLVTSGTAGVATITTTVTGDDTLTESDTTTFTVEAPTSLTITAPNTVLLADGFTTNLETTASSASLSNVPVEDYPNFFYSSSDTSIAEVDAATGVVTPGGVAGVATITAEMEGVTETVDITVEAATSITATALTDTLYIGGAGVTVEVTASSASITDMSINGLWALYFDSTDFDVAPVDDLSGLVTPGTFTGTADIVATFPGVADAVVEFTVLDPPVKPTTMIHRYEFNNPAGAAVANDPITDSVGTAHGTVEGLNGTFTGTTLELPGGVESLDTAYVNLPNGMISGIPSVDSSGISFEVWISHNDTTAWIRAFDFGNNTAGEDMVSNRQTSTIDLIARRSGSSGAVSTEFTLSRDDFGTVFLQGSALQGSNSLTSPSLTTGVQSQLVLTLDPETGIRKLYKDGVLIGKDTIAFDNNSIAAVDDVNNWLGRSNAGDPRLNGSLDEFRIYTGILTGSQVVSNYIGGPDVIVVPVPYATWSGANAGGQSPNQDFDNDGVPNGVEYFMGETGSGFTANPGIVSDQISWPISAEFVGTYSVQISYDLVNWTDVPSVLTPGFVTYDEVAGVGPFFARLKVLPTQ